MTEFYLAEPPYPAPARCVYCGDTRSGLLTSAAEIPGYGFILSCDQCDREKARIRGYAKGTRLKELADAASKIKDVEKQITERDATIRKLIAEAAEAKRAIADRDAMIESYRGKERQQEHLAGVMAETARQLVEIRSAHL